mgnify:CR=1 FL=1
MLLLACLAALPAAWMPAAWSSDWALRKQDSERDIRVYQRDRDDSAYDDLYAVTHMPGSVAQVEAVLADVPAMPEWASRVTHARVLKRQSSEAWIYMQYKLPYPFRARDAVVRLRRSQDDGAVTIRSQSVSGWIAAQPERLRMTNMQTTWKLSPAGGNQVRVELWGSGEPGGLIPAVLYNYNLADDATQTLRQLRRMALREKYLDNRSASRTRP